MEAPRVLVVTNMYPSESRPYAGIFVQRQVSDLRRAGVPIEVVVIGGERGRGDYIAARARVRHAVRHFRPAIIHCHYGYTPLAAVRLGVPYLVTLCGDDINGAWNGARGSTLKSRAGVLVTQWLARGARMVIVKSCAMQQRLWPAARRRSVLVPNGVDTTVFTPGPRLDPRRRFQVDGPGVVLGFVHSIRQRTKRAQEQCSPCGDGCAVTLVANTPCIRELSQPLGPPLGALVRRDECRTRRDDCSAGWLLLRVHGLPTARGVRGAG